MRPIHPGDVLREDFLVPLQMTRHALAIALRVPASRINDIVLERRGVTLDTALRLARYFGGDAESWLNLQNAYDLKNAQKEQAFRGSESSPTIDRPFTATKCDVGRTGFQPPLE